MRNFTICALAAVTLASAMPARAADLDYGVLRGAEEDYVAPVDWSGFYIGAHGGYTTSNYGFSKAGQSELALMLQGLALENEFSVSSSNKLADARADGGSFGAFAGYNVQVDDIVFGVELDYTHAGQTGRSFGDLARKATLSSGIYDNYTIVSEARGVLEDYATARGRIGWALGSFLPYVTAGAAFGRARTGTLVNVHIDESTDIEGKNIVGTLDKTGGSIKERYRFGAAFGAGAEYMITQNIFARAEYQYLLFDRFGDTSINVNTVRGAVGVKF